ncbi:MAG: RIP metalloprotease RseP [Planctomycetes bacterium]|nr:RIP metalloprotease RseP [Planctomycetota bacterium]
MIPVLAMSGLASGAMVVFGIGFLIFIHELGHFLAAKAAGVRVHAFAIGMGPRVFGWRRGDTDYKLCLLPIGGYVRMHGEIPGEGDPDDEGSLTNKSVGWRFLIFSGGVIMNVLFALIAFPIIFSSGVAFTAPVIGEVTEGGAAWEAGLRTGDRVAAIDETGIYSFEQLALESALAGDDPLTFHVQRGDASFDVAVKPHDDPDRGAKTIGIDPSFEPESVVSLVTAEDGSSPAATAGLEEGDVLVRWNDAPMTREQHARWSRALRLGQIDPSLPLHVTVRRGDDTKTVTIEPRMRDGAARLGVAPLLTRIAGIRLPVRTAEDENAEGQTKQLQDAIAATGVRIGDVLIAARVDDKAAIPLVDADDVHDALAAGKTVRLEVLRVPPTAHTRVDATSASLTVDPYFCGPDGAKRFENAIGFGLDDVSGHVFVQPNLGAAKASMSTGARIVTIDGEDILGWQDIVRVVANAREAKKSELEVRWLPFAALTTPMDAKTAIVPLERVADPDYGFVAQFRPLQEVYRTNGILDSLAAGWTSSVDNLRRLYMTLKRMIGGSVSATNLGGIITISVVSYSYANSGWERFVWFLAFLSLNLAFINVLPIPVLDGGHLLFLLIEKIKGSPVSVRVMTYAQVLGIVMVLGLLIFVTFNDIARLLQ